LTRNVYVHFPFCRSKCAYCALYSRTGATASDREEYLESIRVKLESNETLKTLYFGGGSPALCNLSLLRITLNNLTRPYSTLSDSNTTLIDPKSLEFTVELHPLDVTKEKLEELKSIGVNRISMGVQSLDDAILRGMGRGYTADDAERAFALVRSNFDNAGIDLIVGYPGESPDIVRQLSRLADWGFRHCSVYSLQNERGLANVPDDDTVLDRIREVAAFLKSIGLERYEISNYAVPGYECRHNLAVWRGEDYTGIGEGACGREGLLRTRGLRNGKYDITSVSPEEDLKERTIFRLRTRDGLDASRFPEWIPNLDRFVGEGLLVRIPDTPSPIYRLTERGTEVCDTILSDLL